MQIGFEECLLDTDRRELRRGDELVALEPQVFDVLIYLIENRDRVVSKDDLIASVWSGRIVSESTLTSRINAVRKAIGDSGEKQSLIRTFAKKGFRFIAPVDVKNKEMEPAAPPDPAFGVPTKPSIAVLPFSNMSGEPDQDSFVDGVTEEIITALSRVRWFFVIARGSTFAYKSSAIGPEQIARELGVRYILMGSVRRAGDRIRVTAQLIDANNRSNVWARSYDRAASDIFSVQDEITQTIVGGIEPELSRAERERARVKQRDNLDGWSTYQRGMLHLYRYTQDDLAQARKLFEEAIGIDPDLGPAYSGLAEAYYYEVVYGFVHPGNDRANALLNLPRRLSLLIETMPVRIAPWEEFAISAAIMLLQSPSWRLHWTLTRAWHLHITVSVPHSSFRADRKLPSRIWNRRSGSARTIPTWGPTWCALPRPNTSSGRMMRPSVLRSRLWRSPASSGRAMRS